ncbi:tyrosine--tRNA ligase, mitochondrial-like isoform X4 [Saccostrea echinata]|uniref:tyrosine--tRNA ligase, mitochondrial-like isoform X3 n=1 Tax=Saccostrea echinata TaxID=191078 RepID=UPI002A834457|nr:tyrosine--tRNA ligase, mitochondrial-like isoform X3 [Saccostrea echinata]XP_061180939.1 tyrosine--tRNA ligase, mitochondrial-like isoform X4 [Saccostrea echinata]
MLIPCFARKSEMAISKLSLRLCQRAIVSLHRSYCTVSPRNVLKLRERGVVHSVFPATHIHELEKQLGQPLTVYCGFDPTADSLHIGNLLAIIALLHCQRAGHHTICVVGGATAQIGDPSGRTKDRDPMKPEVVERNVASITESLERIFSNHQRYFWRNQSRELPAVRILNNIDWYSKKSVIDFLSTLGRKFRVGSMMHMSSVKTRMESEEGLSLTEFTYQVFQACDWLHLYENYNCTVQVGGSDQLGNIVSGYEFLTKIHKRLFFGLMVPLLTTSGGEKLGKSANNSVWLNPDKTTPFHLYQHFINLPDADVETYLKLFTFLTKSEIQDCLADLRDRPELRRSQKTIAEEVVKLVHGEVGLEQALRWTDVFYNQKVETLAVLTDLEVNILFRNSPITSLPLSPGLRLADVCNRIKVFKNEGEAEEKIKSGQVKVNFRQEKNPDTVLREMEHILPNDITLITQGRKIHHVIKWAS